MVRGLKLSSGKWLVNVPDCYLDSPIVDLQMVLQSTSVRKGCCTHGAVESISQKRFRWCILRSGDTGVICRPVAYIRGAGKTKIYVCRN